MGFSDADFISKEKHELDYVLKKWEKRTTQANRDILSNALDEFRKDPANSPYTRDIFYSWAEKTALKPKLEAREETFNSKSQDLTEDKLNQASGETVSKDEVTQTAGENKKQESEKSTSFQSSTQKTENAAEILQANEIKPEEEQKQLYQKTIDKNLSATPNRTRPWWHWLFVALGVIAVVVIVVLLLRGCDKTVDNAPNISQKPIDNLQKTENKVLTPGSLPADLSSFRFAANSTTMLQKGEEAKLAALAAKLNNYSSGKLLLSGWCAKYGNPDLDAAITASRADYIKQRLLKAGIPAGIIITAVGRGADSNQKKDSSFSRRVDVSVE